MRDPLPEAYELVEDGHITEDNFRDFVFTNAVRLWGTQNPRLLRGHAGREGSRGGSAGGQPAALRRRGEVGPGQTPPSLPPLEGGVLAGIARASVGDQYRPAPEGISLDQGNFSLRPQVLFGFIPYYKGLRDFP